MDASLNPPGAAGAAVRVPLKRRAEIKMSDALRDRLYLLSQSLGLSESDALAASMFWIASPPDGAETWRDVLATFQRVLSGSQRNPMSNRRMQIWLRSVAAIREADCALLARAGWIEDLKAVEVSKPGEYGMTFALTKTGQFVAKALLGGG